MNSDEITHRDEDYLPWLVACDNALAQGDAQRGSSGSTDLPATWRARLEGDLAFIQMLRKVLPRRDLMEDAGQPPGDLLNRLGRFEIRRELGRGAFGVVFLAWDPQLGREVALKVPRTEVLITAELRQRFIREARAAAVLDHPNVVPVYEAGEVGPICYIASAYCPGPTLAQWLKERSDPVPLPLAAKLVATLAEAVHHAHGRGVVHRDLKPSNVLLQRQPCETAGSAHSAANKPETTQHLADVEGEVVPRITDFGLAKLIVDPQGLAGEESAPHTQTGALLGTPNYMAPEQASGKTKDIGFAADVYALGVILYELLTGRPPFRGETTLETLEQVRSQEPLPPSRLRTKLSRDLETICLKCLQKDPRKRYVSAAALADDLQRHLAGSPIKARPIGVWERGVKAARRRPAMATLAAASLLATLIVAAQFLGYSAALARKNVALGEALQQANHDFRLARIAVDEYATKVSQDKRLLAHDLEDLRKELLRLPVGFYKEFVTQRAGDPDVQEEHAKAFRRLALLNKELGSQQEALEELRAAAAICKKLVHDHPDDVHYQDQLAASLNNLAAVYMDIREANLAEEAFQEVHNIRQQLALTDPTAPEYQAFLSDSYTNLALLFQETGRYEPAESANRQARDLLAKLVQEHPDVEEYQAGLAVSHFNLGLLYEETNRLGLAEEAYGKAQDLRRNLVNNHQNTPEYQENLADVLVNLGLVYTETGRAARAQESFGEAKEVYQKLLARHPRIPNYKDKLARAYHNLGQAHEELGQPVGAEAAYAEARKLREGLVRDYPEVPDYQFGLSRTQTNLALLFCNSGRPGLASAPLREAQRIREKLVHDYPDVTDYRVKLGNTYGILGLMDSLQDKPQAALDWFARAVQTLEAILEKEPRHTFARQFICEAYERRAATLTKLRRHNDALRDLDRLLELADAQTRNTRRSLRAATLARMGDHGAAVNEADAVAAMGSLSAESMYHLACTYAACAAAVRQDPQISTAEQRQRADKYEVRAVDLLSKARAAGFFRETARIEEMRQDEDLAPLRRRRDFQELFPLKSDKDPPKGSN
jgi:serine/threonine protein kinase/tetratricopeptide (TPR) repeat protein